MRVEDSNAIQTGILIPILPPDTQKLNGLYLKNMDKIPPIWYHVDMEEFITKQDGFKGERIIVLPTEALQEYLNHPMIRRLYLTDVGFFPLARYHERIRKEGIAEYILLYCVEGSGDIWVNDSRYHLAKNEAFCIPSNHPHRYCASREQPWSILWVHFKGEDTQYYPFERCQVIKPTVAEENRMMSLFDLLFSALEDDYSLGNFIYISQVLSLILAQLYQRCNATAQNGQNKHLTYAIRYMYRHLHENLTLTRLSDELELSKSYLNVIFQKYAHRAPLEFFVHLKMTEACKMLKSTDLHVYEVAQQLGYADPYYFSRLFKKVVGVAPKEYKNGNYFYHDDAKIVHQKE